MDIQLPYVLFAYCTSVQESTKASPFFLLYGRDPKLPTATALNPPVDWVTVDLVDYKTEVAIRMSTAWESAKTSIGKAQKQQKYHDNKQAKDPKVSAGDEVFVYFPAKKCGRAYKFARPAESTQDDNDLPEGGLDMERLEAVSDGEGQDLEDSTDEQECTTATWENRLRSRRCVEPPS